MCNLSTIKDPYTQKAHTAISHPHQRRHIAFSSRDNGPNHGTTSTGKIQCHTDNCRPWMLQGSPIPTMRCTYLRSRNCPAIPQPHLPMVWTPQKDHQQQRSKIHITLRKITHQVARNSTKPINCSTPSNRWTVRMKESMGRTIPEAGNWGSTGRLVRMAHNSHGSS